MGVLSDVALEVVSELRGRSRLELYRSDPVAWYWDVLGGVWWSKQLEVVEALTRPDRALSQVLVKSCNGVGKTKLAADLATWFVSVFDPMELSVLITAPIFKQIKTGLFSYIADNYSVAAGRGVLLPGRITAEPALKVRRLDGGLDKEVVQAKRPADSNLVSSFQGTHDGVVVVLMDEAGGLPEDLWVGANAVTTNEVAKILAIGNPDALNTAFHRRFVDVERFSDWDRFTISAYDSPNFTGEVLFDDPVRDREVKSRLVQVDWAEMMVRQAHPSVVRAKVFGEFPDDDVSSFYTQAVLNTAYDTELGGVGGVRRLGVDLAFTGSDKSVAYLNVGGRVRLVSEVNYEDDFMEAARWVHGLALSHGVDEVRVDASGAGRGVFSLLESQEEFAGGDYGLVGVTGGSRSPDVLRWAQARAWHHDLFRGALQGGLVDLDPDDSALRDEMLAQSFGLNAKGAIQLTPKHEMRAKGLSSPDHLDAAVYSVVDFGLPDSQEQGRQPGDVVVFDPSDIVFVDYFDPGGAF